MYMYKQDLTFITLQGLMCHKIKPFNETLKKC